MRRTNIGEVRRVKGNGRYRILIYNEEYYLIDIGTSFWTNIFPYLFWIFRNPGYKIDREVALQLTINQKINMGKGARYGLIGSGIAITFSGILVPLVGLTTINSPLYLNVVITILLIGLLIWAFVFLMYKQEQRMISSIDYSQLPKLQIRISRPKFRLVMRTVYLYLFSLAFTILCLLAFITESNLYVLFLGLLLFFLFLFANGAALDYGNYKIDIKK